MSGQNWKLFKHLNLLRRSLKIWLFNCLNNLVFGQHLILMTLNMSMIHCPGSLRHKPVLCDTKAATWSWNMCHINDQGQKVVNEIFWSNLNNKYLISRGYNIMKTRVLSVLFIFCIIVSWKRNYKKKKPRVRDDWNVEIVFLDIP